MPGGNWARLSVVSTELNVYYENQSVESLKHICVFHGSINFSRPSMLFAKSKYALLIILTQYHKPNPYNTQ